LARDPWVVVAPGDRTAGPVVSMNELASSPLVGQPTTSCQLLVDRELALRAVEPDYVFRTSDNSAVQAMVRAGVGMAIMPLLAVDLDDPDVTFCELDPPLTDRVIAVAHAAKRTPSPAAVRLIEIATEQCKVVDERRARFRERQMAAAEARS
jgi:DNA-binding transcriptional LysR family regulator